MNKKVDFDDYTEDYNQLLNEATSFFSSDDEYFARYKVDLIKKNTGQSVARILEYGCGIGRNIPFLLRAFPDAKVYGSDISVASIDCARSNYKNVEFFIEHEGLYFDKKFDLIFVAGVFHHVPLSERQNVAKVIYERLTEKGVAFIFEHNPFNPITKKIVNNCPYDEDAILLKPSELSNILINCGFSIKKQSFCLFVPPKLSFLKDIEAKLGWLPLGGQYFIKASLN